MLFTFGTMALIEMLGLLYDDINGAIFFLGVGLTFMFLYMIRNAENKLEWAKWPGGILLGFSVFVYLQNVDWMDGDFIFPAILILVGGFLIVRASIRKK